MADVDTSIFTKAPEPNAFLNTASGYMGLANQSLQNQQQQLELLLARQGAFGAAVTALASDPNLSYDKIVQEGQRMVDLGIIPPDQLSKNLQGLPPTSSPDQLRQFLNTVATRSTSALENLQRNFGVPINLDTGANILSGVQSVNGTTFNTATPKSLTPEAAASPVKVPTPTGAEMTIPLATFAGAATAPGGPGGFAGPSPQQQKMFEASAGQYQDALAASGNYQNEILPLEKMLEILPTVQSGVGTNFLNDAKKALASFGVDIAGSMDEASAISELEKYSAQLARASGAAPGSDRQLDISMVANPGTSTDNAAAQRVVKTLITYRRMQQALALKAQSSGLPPEQFSQFASQFGSQVDPRAFGFDLMTPEAKTKLRKELEGDEKAASKFFSTYDLARETGLLR